MENMYMIEEINDNNNPKVSVIIPVYNGEACISIPLNSLLKQTYPDFEVVIIDDGSTDSTKDVVEKYTSMDNRFKYYYQTNQGVSAARNKGMELSRGEFITFLDSDDFHEETFLDKMVDKIQRESADVCYCGHNIVTPDKSKKRINKFKSKHVLIDYILDKVPVNTGGWMIRKKLIEEFDIKFPIGVSWGEDVEFFCEVLSRTDKITYVNEYLANYRVGFEKNRLSALRPDKLDKDYESIQRMLNNKCINKDAYIEKALIDYRLSALLTYRLVTAIQEGLDHNEIIAYYKKYEPYINKISWNNGLRSIKLYIKKRRLWNEIRRKRHV
jgi:glycosyltransferase involved in cell wall biosynthesis